MTRKLEICEQADATWLKASQNELYYHITYSWLVEAQKGAKLNKQHEDWLWVSGNGCRGCWTTKNYNLALQFAKDHNLTITSNGSHQVHNVPMACDSLQKTTLEFKK